MSVFVSKQHTILARVTCPRCQGRHSSQACPSLRNNPPAKRKRKRRTKQRKLVGIPDTSLPTDARGWFTRLYPLVRYTLKRKLSSLPAWQQDDALATGLCFSWGAFQWAWKKYGAEKAPVDVARMAAYMAAKKAICGQQYASQRQGGYVDALDTRFRRDTVDLGMFPAPRSARTAPWDTQDMSKVCSVIGELPEHLRGVAFCLAANHDMQALVRSVIGSERKSGELTKREIAAYVGVSVDTVYRRMEEMQGCECLDSLDTEE